MLTQAMPALAQALRGVIPDNAVRQLMQALGNCNQPLVHRGPVSVQPQGPQQSGPGFYNGQQWDPNQFRSIVDSNNIYNNNSFIDAPFYSTYFGGDQFSFPTFTTNVTNQYITNFFPQDPSGGFGRDGRDGRDGFGRDGRDGASGRDGAAGRPGAGGVGRRGPSGPPGNPGRAGQDGQGGPAGPPGADGRDGREGRDGRDGRGREYWLRKGPIKKREYIVPTLTAGSTELTIDTYQYDFVDCKLVETLVPRTITIPVLGDGEDIVIVVPEPQQHDLEEVKAR